MVAGKQQVLTIEQVPIGDLRPIRGEEKGNRPLGKRKCEPSPSLHRLALLSALMGVQRDMNNNPVSEVLRNSRSAHQCGGGEAEAP